MERDLDSFNRYFEVFQKCGNAQAVFSAEWQLAALYRELGMTQEKAALKEKLLEKLDTLPLNEYLRISYRERIMRL